MNQSSIQKIDPRLRSLIIKAVGILILILILISSIYGVLKNSNYFFQSYLFSFLFWSDLPLGALPLIMVYHLTGGQWGAASLKILEAISDTIVAIAIFSIPILIWIKSIYPWTDPQIASTPDILHKQVYLNPESFAARTVFYFICWYILNHCLQQGKKRGSGPSEIARLRCLSAGGLVLSTLLSTFASIDWQMSVEPKWTSTIYGLVYGIAQAMSAYSFALIVFGFAASKRDYMNRFPKKTLWDLGNILLMLVMVWTYLSFMQYLVIWSGNLPHEVVWFIHRTQGGWQWLVFLITIFQFLVPFLFLLFRRTKSRPSRLAWIGGVIFLIRCVDHYWWVMPGFIPEHLEFRWMALTTWLGLGGLWFAYFLRRLLAQPLFAESDPNWQILPEDRDKFKLHQFQYNKYKSKETPTHE